MVLQGDGMAVVRFILVGAVIAVIVSTYIGRL